MKKILYYASIVLTASAVMVSCQKDEDNGNVSEPEKLATPVVRAEVGETEVTVSWEAIANAASYSYTVDSDEAITTVDTSITLAVADLSVGNHTVSVIALPEEGSEQWLESDAASAIFNIEPGPDDVPAVYAPWVGTWTVTTTQSLEWVDAPNNPGFLAPQYINDPMTFDVEIYYDSEKRVIFMTGWTPSEASFGQEMPVSVDVNDMGYLEMYSGVEIGSTGDGDKLTWLAMDETCQFVSDELFAAYTCMLKGDVAEGLPTTIEVEEASGELTEVTVNSLDLYGISEAGVGLYAQSASPAGSFTMTRKASGTSSNIAPFSAGQVYDAAKRFVKAGNILNVR